MEKELGMNSHDVDKYEQSMPHVSVHGQHVSPGMM